MKNDRTSAVDTGIQAASATTQVSVAETFRRVSDAITAIQSGGHKPKAELIFKSGQEHYTVRLNRETVTAGR